MRTLLLLFLFLAGCTPSPHPKNTLRVSFNAHPTTLDPRKAGDFVSSTLICLIYEGLTRCAPEGKIELALAEEVEVSKDEKTYLFYLREAYWSNGKPITAYDFERSWKEILSQASISAYLFYPIKNGEKCVKGEISINEVGITALDERTLSVELERPTPYFLSLTAFPSFLPAPNEEKTYAGPFQIEKMVNHSEIILSKNPTYWNQNEIALDEIHISIIPDEMTALQMFERGDLDWLGGPISPLPPDALEKLKDQITFVPNAGTTLCTFNTETFPFHNNHLRKAFSLAINRKEIVEKVTQSGQNPATTFLPQTLSNQSVSLYDPDRARRHFQKALEELNIQSQELESLCLYYKPAQIEKRLAQTLQRQWEEVLGIKIQLVQLDFKSHAQRLETRDYQLSLAAWIAQFNDPISILDRFKDRDNLKNYPGWENTQYAKLLTQASGSEERLILFEQAIALLAEESPLTPIYHWSSPSLCSPQLEGVEATPCGGILFERFRLKSKDRLYRNDLKDQEYVKEVPRFLFKLTDAEAAKLKKFSDESEIKSGSYPTLTETDSLSHSGILLLAKNK